MKHFLRNFISTIAIITLFLCISGCANLMEGFVDGLLESKKEAKQRQQDPAVMIEEIEHQRSGETSQYIQSQDKIDEAAQKKQFDEMLQKQLQRQEEHGGVN